jgi:hypothetical protein
VKPLLIVAIVLCTVLALAGFMSDESAPTYALATPACIGAVVLTPLFLYLSARQSRKDRERK